MVVVRMCVLRSRTLCVCTFNTLLFHVEDKRKNDNNDDVADDDNGNSTDEKCGSAIKYPNTNHPIPYAEVVVSLYTKPVAQANMNHIEM